MPRAPLVRNDLQARPSASAQGAGGASGVGQSQSSAIRSVAEEQAQSQHDLSVNGGLDADLTDMHVNETGAIGIGGGPGELIRVGREGHASQAEADDQFDERVSSSPSIDDEDIDFEFVYALHTFVATVEGQANAVKGETMVLLDDSNSYWWLVRIVKDSSIGYLPAEHIETPSERLARLNKHRNVDLSASMLHDTPAKSQNPIRNALRRRGAKSVAFAPTQYFEYAAPSDEEAEGEEGAEVTFTLEESEETDGMLEEEDEITPVEPLEIASRSTTKPTPAVETIERDEDNKIRKTNTTSLKDIDTALLNSDKIETKKITLTPRVAQDDSSITMNSIAPSGKDVCVPPLSADATDTGGLDFAAAEGRQGKEGQQCSGGFFRKRPKKGKDQDSVEEFLSGGGGGGGGGGGEKSSIEGRDSQDSVEPRQQGPEPRKLEPRREQPRQTGRRQEPVQEPVRQYAPPPQVQPGSTIRKVEPESQPPPAATAATDEKRARGLLLDVEDESKTAAERRPSPTKVSIIDETQRQQPSPRPTTAGNKSAERTSPTESESQKLGIRVDTKQDSPPPLLTTTFTSPSEVVVPESAFSASPEPIDNDPPPPLVADNASDDQATSPIDENTPPATATAAAAVTWSDSSLRTFLEDSNDVKDFLVLVHDRSDITIRNDHPEIGPLFQEANEKLQNITNRLDELLVEYLQRRGRS
ncbi:hypothetical protein BDZ91DRAFT_795090 [Kalaharituber pfeilii]|nr:hypothetical protein BDZ91DRAFT_795090 [Kalaharituber pfeilii]